MLLDTSTQHEGELKCTSNTTQIHLKCTPPHSSPHTHIYRETVALQIRVCSRGNSGTYLGSTSRKSTRAHITAQRWRRARLDLSRMEQGRACMCKRARGIDSTSARRMRAPIHQESVLVLSYCPVVVLVQPVLLLSYPESRPAPRGARRRRASARRRRATTDWTRVLRKLEGSVY